MKFLYLDTETTGVSEQSAIVQIAGCIEIEGEVKEWFNIRCKPHPNAHISEKALEVTGLTLEQINKEQEPKEAIKQLIAIFDKYINRFDKNDKFVMVCHNVPFDLKMLYSFFNRLGNKFLGSYVDFKLNFCTLSTIKALQVVQKIPFLENNKLETWCKYFKIDLENAHDALSDIKATRELFKEIYRVLKS